MADNEMIVPIACDHGGFELKEYLLKALKKQNFLLKDFGTFSEDSVDYPDFIHPLASAINSGEFSRGIILCGSGQGANMTANKYSDVRSALCWDVQQAKLSRQHNDANIIALPGRFIDFDVALDAVLKFMDTAFEGGRHIRRVEKISDLKI